MLTVLPTRAAHATLDSLDPTFDSDGIATTPFGAVGNEDVSFALGRQPDGKLVVAGRSGDDFALARYNADGSLDTTFDVDGKVTTDIGIDSFEPDEAHAVLIQPDGKIVAAGAADMGSGAGFTNFALARYNADGSPDTTFDGDGIATPNVGGFDRAWALAIQADGKLVAAGERGQDFGLARLNSDGSLDATFDVDGKVVTNVSTGAFSQTDAAHAVLLQPDGKIVAAGFATMDSGGSDSRDFALVRYDSGGSPDITFDGDGKVTTPISTEPNFNADEAHALVIQSDGKLVVAGQASVDPDSFALARYNSDGSLDTSFDDDGKVTTSLSPIDNTSVAWGLALRGDGKLVAAGRAANFDPDSGFFHHEFAAARYNADGSLDTTFDVDGKDTTAVAPDGQVDISRAVLIQPDGKAVLGGYADMGPPESFDYDFALIRYLPDGDTPPETSIDSGPSGPTGDSTPTFTFSSTDADSTFECRVDSDPFASCESPYTTAELAAGAHTFEVQATDSGGNTDLTAASQSFIVCSIIGTSGTDTLVGGAGDEVICGLGGRDTLKGGGGNDQLLGGDGADLMFGGTQDDSFDGGSGSDIVSFNEVGVTSGVTADLTAGTATSASLGSDTFVSSGGVPTVESLRGSRFNDSLTGSTAANTLEGGNGDDTVAGLGGVDTLIGGAGADSLTGDAGGDNLRPGTGNDPVVDGGTGTDRVLYQDVSSAGVTVDLDAGTATGGGGTDTLSNIENATGTPLGDSISGNDGGNKLNGIGGGDSLDTQDGISGNDTADGGGGTDTCTVDAGDIVLNCP